MNRLQATLVTLVMTAAITVPMWGTSGCGGRLISLPTLEETGALHPYFLKGIFHATASGSSLFSISYPTEVAGIVVEIEENRKFIQEGSPLTAPIEQVLFEEFAQETWYPELMAIWYGAIAIANQTLGPTPTTGDVLGAEWTLTLNHCLDGIVEGSVLPE